MPSSEPAEAPLAAEERADLVYRIAAKRELKRRRDEAPLFYFEPTPKQLALIQALIDGGVRGGIFTGSNRCGKTTILIYLMFCYSYGVWFHLLPDWAKRLTADGDYPRREDVPRECWTTRADGVPTDMPAFIQVVSGLAMDRGIGAVVWPKILQMLPKNLRNSRSIKAKRGPGGTVQIVTLPNGSVCRFGSQEQGSMAFEGAVYTAVLFDEPVIKSVFTACWRGLIDKMGRFVMTMTPLGRDAVWVRTELLSAERKISIRRVTALHTDNPHLPKGAFEAFISGLDMTEEERIARTTGEFGHLSFLAFPTFAREAHVCKPFHIPHHWPIVCACDPASRRPFFFVWLAFDPAWRRWYVIKEHPYGVKYMTIRTANQTIADYATLIRNMEGERPADYRWIDPRFGVAEQSIKGARSTSVVDDLAQYGLFFSPDVPDTGRIETGLLRLRALLDYDRSVPLSDLNQPRLQVFETCTNVIEALEQYSFVPPNVRSEMVLDEKLLEEYKDPIDALRYAILAGEPHAISRGPRSGWGFTDERDLARENTEGWD